MITTEAWVLEQGNGKKIPLLGLLHKEQFTFADIKDHEMLVEPLFGCWEGNMDHALNRLPIDICQARSEPKVVLGNAGVVRVIKVGSAVKQRKLGDLCIVFCNGEWDAYGYPTKILAYDAPNTMGVLAKITKLHERQTILIPPHSHYSLEQWAAFSLRYITAWANWKVAYGTWRLQVTEEDCPEAIVWGWGGGVTLAELTLAKLHGCKTAMITSHAARMKEIENKGILAIDRNQFPFLNFDEKKYNNDPIYRKNYLESEESFLNLVKKHTDSMGVSIFIDFIGAPVLRSTLKALAREGVISTAGWKDGMKISTLRAIECIQHHSHINTHYARYAQGLAAVCFAEETGWMPEIDTKIYDWDEIPQLAAEYHQNKITSYFPIFRINQ